jgi:hypothetical protein
MAGAPFPEDGPEPPLGLSREAVGYLVVSGGIAAAVLVLFLFPRSAPLYPLSRFGAALLVAAGTAWLNDYATGTWYDQFERTASSETRE